MWKCVSWKKTTRYANWKLCIFEVGLCSGFLAGCVLIDLRSTKATSRTRTNHLHTHHLFHENPNKLKPTNRLVLTVYDCTYNIFSHHLFRYCSLHKKIISDAVSEEIKQAYHEKLREFHPDKRPNSQEGRGKRITAQLMLGERNLGTWMTNSRKFQEIRIKQIKDISQNELGSYWVG